MINIIILLTLCTIKVLYPLVITFICTLVVQAVVYKLYNISLYNKFQKFMLREVR